MPSDEVARDTIAAIATPAGRGAIAVVRVSGGAVPAIAQRLMGQLPPPRQATFTAFRDASGAAVDEGLAIYFPAPHSYTGEPVIELHGHGGAVVAQAVLAACLDAGARLAEPGEFTRRAYLEGKLDLAQAEAVADLIDAASREAARSAVRSLRGEFSAAIDALRAELIDLRALTEAMLDFPEEEIDELHQRDAGLRLNALRERLAQVLEKSRQGSLLRTGLHIVLAGRPNVGKSSLLNRLAGEERAIVTPVPGTTRDALREPLQIDGVPLTVVDTAGLREPADEIERLGIARTERELAQADLVVAVHEAGRATAPLEKLPEGVPRLNVYNKVDLSPSFSPPPGGLAVSAKTGQGVAALRHALLATAGWASAGETVFLARERHIRALERAAVHVAAAKFDASQLELFAEELRFAQTELAAIVGEYTSDDLLGEIFARFCIGK